MKTGCIPLYIYMKPLSKEHKLILIALGFVSGFLYSFWLLGYFLNRVSFTQLDISALQARGQPYSTLFILGDILAGVVVVVMAYLIARNFHDTNLWIKRAFKLCLIGMVTFGIMTAVSCLLPSCIASSAVCDTRVSQVLDIHDVTGGIAAFGLFLSLVGLLQLIYSKLSARLFSVLLILLLTWSVSGVLFVILSLQIRHAALIVQHIFLLLTSLSLIAIPFTVTRNGLVD